MEKKQRRSKGSRLAGKNEEEFDIEQREEVEEGPNVGFYATMLFGGLVPEEEQEEVPEPVPLRKETPEEVLRKSFKSR
jgi:hypothetical protein